MLTHHLNLTELSSMGRYCMDSLSIDLLQYFGVVVVFELVLGHNPNQ